jgi:hypothetical protein
MTHITAVWGIASINNSLVEKHRSRAPDAVISVYDAVGKLLEEELKKGSAHRF